MINREIIIRLPIPFRKPLGLGMSDKILEKAGLTKPGVKINGTILYSIGQERKGIYWTQW